MNIVCISASNVEQARHTSASTRACQIVASLLHEQYGPTAQVNIIPLLDYELKPCRMCGSCYKTGECRDDPAFNSVYAQLKAADGVFLVCPHYAPLPSKVMMLLEKLEEMVFLKSCSERDFRFSLAGKLVGLIVHGGQTETALPYYRTALLEPLANAFASLQMQVIPGGDEWPTGVAFGIKNLGLRPNSIFVDIEHDWEAVRASLRPLVNNVAAFLKS